MATRSSLVKKPKTATRVAPKKTSARKRAATQEGLAGSIAVFIGKNMGKAVKQTRAVGSKLSSVGAEVVEAGSRAAEAIKEHLPEAVGGPPATPRRKAKSSRAKNAKTPSRRQS